MISYARMEDFLEMPVCGENQGSISQESVCPLDERSTIVDYSCQHKLEVFQSHLIAGDSSQTISCPWTKFLIGSKIFFLNRRLK